MGKCVSQPQDASCDQEAVESRFWRLASPTRAAWLSSILFVLSFIVDLVLEVYTTRMPCMQKYLTLGGTAVRNGMYVLCNERHWT